MRAEVKKNSELGAKLKEYQAKGELVPTEMTVDIVVSGLKPGPYKYLLDGFPRTSEQAIYLEQFYIEIDYILNFTCPEETQVERLTKRSNGSTRADDDPEIHRKRIKEFNEVTKECLDFYDKLGVVKNIDCQGGPESVS